MTKFGDELSDVIKRYVDAGTSPRVIAIELGGAATAWLGLTLEEAGPIHEALCRYAARGGGLTGAEREQMELTDKRVAVRSGDMTGRKMVN